MRQMHAQYRFHAVGQGLFATGWAGHRNARRISWVYDCGTSSSDVFLVNALARFAKNGVNRLEVATISHFDKDHISGFVRLLGISRIDNLLLPYLPLAERLQLALMQNLGADDQALQFLVDPVGFIAAIPDANVGRIVFVRGSNGEPPPPPNEGEEIVETPNLDGPPPIRVDIGEPDKDESEDFAEFSASIGRSVEDVAMLRQGGRLTSAAFWEFVPYNDIEGWQFVTPAFATEARKRRATLLSANPGARQAALDDLKAIYDSTFGTKPRERNIISLFLYAAPLLPPTARYKALMYAEGDPRRPLIPLPLLLTSHLESLGILYTGDGYLKTQKQMDRLLAYFGRGRARLCVQVMHHGSSGNSHPGAAARLAPMFSVFSSDPTQGLRHPHTQVVADFRPYHPLYANTTQEAFVYWCVEIP